jgi:glycosyltransferase involved in cell wall biosynthesis
MPVYNVERFVADAVRSVLNQSFSDFELLIIDDMSPDGSIAICEGFDDPRIRIIRHHENRGLAGARNTGIRHARGELLAFIDSDDMWREDKLEKHVAHLQSQPQVGVSFSRSAFINEDGTSNRCFQMPKLKNILPNYYLCRNPIGNGSAPVIRRQVFEGIRFDVDRNGETQACYFDEGFRRSEDIECWIRIALKVDCSIEGIPEPLTLYRLNSSGLSASLYQQLESWEQVIEKTRGYAPEFIEKWEHLARAYQLRYLARQAIRLYDGKMAAQFVHRALASDAAILVQEPGRTLLTIMAAYLLRFSPNGVYRACEATAQKLIGLVQSRRIRKDLRSSPI